MKKRINVKALIVNIITFIILIMAVYFAYQFYQSNNFNEFIRSEAKHNISVFKRDEKVKYSDINSYRITSNDYNDAMFSKEIQVQKNTPYRVTCMVKTKDVEAEKNASSIGAQISISNTTERSIAISGDTEWQEIELIFNSKDRDTVDIAFRLGGTAGHAKGEAWFSDFKLEEGKNDENSEWKFACFIFENTNVVIDNKNINIQVTKADKTDIKNTIDRFENGCYDLSEGKMTADCDIYDIQEPITSLSYDDEFGYYVAPEDIEKQIKDTINQNNYDHIFVVVRLGNEEYEDDIEIKDWIGLGSMDYYGIGFSNIRLPNSSKSYIYKYNTRVNQFPEEVFLHEFLHSLERTAKEYGYDIPELHAYKEYGYENEYLIGQKNWYKAYMNKEIYTSNGYIGLPSEIYTLKPAKKSNFSYAYELEVYKEPQNVVEEIRGIFGNLYRNIKLVSHRGRFCLKHFYVNFKIDFLEV